MAALTDRKALWVLDYSAVRVTIDMAGEREHQKVLITSRVRLSLIYLVVSSLSVIKPKINESPVPYISVYKSRNLSQNKILHRQFVLYTGNTLREEIIPKAS